MAMTRKQRRATMIAASVAILSVAMGLVLYALSGTITKRSLHDFAHILEWCLGKRRMPLPSTQRDLEDWARAIDVDKERDFRPRMLPGALTRMFNDAEKTLGQADLVQAARPRHRDRGT